MFKHVFTKITICLLLLCAIITPLSVYAITYYVRFNPNGGSGTMSNQSFSTDEEKYLSTNTFTRTGYNFIGWNSNSGGTGTWYMPSRKVKNLSSTNGATVDVYAQWINSNQGTIKIGTTEVTKDSGGNYNIDNHKNYTVQVNVTNGTVNTSSKSVEYYTNATFTITASTNYNNPTVSCTNSQSASISGSTLTVASVSNNTVCTVTYSAIMHTLTANANNGSIPSTSGWTGTGTTATKSVMQGSSYGTLPTPTRDTYRFDGWFTDATNGSQVTSATTMGTANTTIYAHWTKTYAITYNAGNATSVTGLPSTQTKIDGIDIAISTTEPTSSDKAFLGWATVENATNTSGTWYDPGDVYSTDEDLILYAQWYNVNSLEQSYTTYVQSGDFKQIPSSFTINNLSNGVDKVVTNTVPSLSGYTNKGFSYYNMADNTRSRVYGVDQDSIKLWGMDAASSVSVTKYYLGVKNRTSTTYSDGIDERIDRLQKLQDVSLTYNNFTRTVASKDNISLSDDISFTLASHTNKEIILPAGYNLSNASSSGTYVSRVFLYRYIISNTSTGSSIGAKLQTSYEVSTKVQISVAYILVDKKTSRTTTFSPTSYDTEGLSRYMALVALNSAKSNYFPASYIKRYTRVEGSTGNIAAWGTATATKSFSIPNGKILGVAGQGVTNGSGGSGSSYSVINKAYVGELSTNQTSATYHMTWYAGNNDHSSTTGHAQTKVFGWGHIWYISSGSLT